MRATVTAVAAVLALIVAGSSVADASTAVSRTCLTPMQTHGLGLSVAAFHKENPSTEAGSLPAHPAYGVAYYWIKTKTEKGCVTAYLAYERARPSLSGLKLLRLFGGTLLPPDAHQVASKKRCSAWESKNFLKHFGMAYVVAVLVNRQGPALFPVPGAVLMLLSRKQIC